MNHRNIVFVVDPHHGAWNPAHLETGGIGGSEEAVIQFARNLAADGHAVRVFHNRASSSAREETADGVTFSDIQDFDADARQDVLIGCRSPLLFHHDIKAETAIHLSCDVEAPWGRMAWERCDHYLCLSKFHAARNGWVPPAKVRVIQLGSDIAARAKGTERTPKRLLYSSSYDRGLERLLEDWPRIHDMGYTLAITYGWGRFDEYAAHNPDMRKWKSKMLARMEQHGVEVLGQLPRAAMDQEYHRADAWILPLNRPDSELYCVNADKAIAAGTMRVVTPHGALKEIGPHTEYSWFFEHGKLQSKPSPQRKVLTWRQVTDQFIAPLVLGREEAAA